jgi:RNA polymerase sigma factor (TIGR02999 family)
MVPGRTRVDEILGSRDQSALHDLMPLVYEELKRIARFHRRSNPATLSTTELVHEAYLKLVGGRSDWDGRAHFFGAASRAVRQVLVDFARRRQAERRGAGFEIVSLGDDAAAVEIQLDEILTIDAALDRLDQVEPRLRQIVELRFFAGVSQADIARMLGVSERPVERDWLKARIVLLETIGAQGAPGAGDARAEHEER